MQKNYQTFPIATRNNLKFGKLTEHLTDSAFHKEYPGRYQVFKSEEVPTNLLKHSLMPGFANW